MAILVSDWLKLKKNSETTNPKGFIVGTNNVCEVFHLNSSFGHGLAKMWLPWAMLFSDWQKH
jgi:hypothetical protein